MANKQKTSSLKDKAVEHGVGGLIFEGAKAIIIWASPFMIAGATAAVGYVEQISWFVIIPVVAFTFAALMTGMLRFDEWRARRVARYKIIFASVAFGIDYKRDKKTGLPVSLERGQLVFTFQNLAHFPINIIVDEISTSIAGRINTAPTYDTREIEVGPAMVGFYRDAIIDLNNEPLKAILEGTGKIKIRYGYLGSETHVLEKNMLVFAGLDHATKMYPTTSWSDTAQ